MKIEEKIITGMFKYRDDIILTEGDFVISPQNYIYVVKQEVVGLNPDDGYPDYYKTYGVNETDAATFEDFEKFLADPVARNELGQKTVTLGLLSQILDSYLAGIRGDGIIEGQIFSDEIWFTDYLNDIKKTSCESDPLDIILELSEINNAYFVVSSDIILSLFTSNNISIPDQTNMISGILRQYTYRDLSTGTGNGYLVRVQELIYPKNGILLFRYSINPNGVAEFNKNRTSTWRGSFIPREFDLYGEVVTSEQSPRISYGNLVGGSSSTTDLLTDYSTIYGGSNFIPDTVIEKSKEYIAEAQTGVLI